MSRRHPQECNSVKSLQANIEAARLRWQIDDHKLALAAKPVDIGVRFPANVLPSGTTGAATPGIFGVYVQKIGTFIDSPGGPSQLVIKATKMINDMHTSASRGFKDGGHERQFFSDIFVDESGPSTYMLTGRYNWINKEKKYQHSVLWHPVLVLFKHVDEGDGSPAFEEVGDVLPIRVSDNWPAFSAPDMNSNSWSTVDDPIWFAKKSHTAQSALKSA